MCYSALCITNSAARGSGLLKYFQIANFFLFIGRWRCGSAVEIYKEMMKASGVLVKQRGGAYMGSLLKNESQLWL